MERCRAAVAAARQRIEARRSAIAAAAAAGAQAAAAAMAGMAGGAAGASAAGSLMGYTNSIIGWLSRVQDALQTCTAGNFLADATCPVCPQQAGSSHSQRQEQQTMAAAAVTVAGALSGLSAGAREFQQHGTKAAHLESYQQYQVRAGLVWAGCGRLLLAAWWMRDVSDASCGKLLLPGQVTVSRLHRVVQVTRLTAALNHT